MRMKHIIIGILIAVAGYAAWYLGSPLFFNTIVDDALPSRTSEFNDSDKIKIEETESLKEEQVDTMSEAERMDAKKMMEELGQKMPETVMDEQPVIVFKGTFKDADSFHRGSGKASIYLLSDGKRVLRFEDFSVTNGPALSVYMVPSESGKVESHFLDLGKLKGNKGNQNYDIPGDIDISLYKSIVIWCVPFGVTFATAQLQ